MYKLMKKSEFRHRYTTIENEPINDKFTVSKDFNACCILPQWLIDSVRKERNGPPHGSMVKIRSQSGKDAIRTWIVIEHHALQRLTRNSELFHGYSSSSSPAPRPPSARP